MFVLKINWGLEFCSCTLISYEEGSLFKNKMSIYYVLLISRISLPQFLLMLPHMSLASAPIGMFVFVFVCLFFFLFCFVYLIGWFGLVQICRIYITSLHMFQ